MTDDTDDLEAVPVPLAPPTWPPTPTPPTGVAAAPNEPRPFSPAPIDERPAGSNHNSVIAVIVAMLIAGIAGFGVTSWLQTGSDFNAATGTPPGSGSGSIAPAADPDAAVLSGLVVQQRDVTTGFSVSLLDLGDQTVGTTTLDLCNGTFPSEALRRARFQVVDVDDLQASVLSTEAVLYKNPAAGAQALSELRSVRAKCPRTPVESKVGEATATFTFHAPPDAAWPRTTGVDRQAYDFDTVNDQGEKHHSVAVYLRRGRAFIGVYFAQPDGAQAPVAGQTTLQRITQVFEKRLAALPDAVVNRG